MVQIGAVNVRMCQNFLLFILLLWNDFGFGFCFSKVALHLSTRPFFLQLSSIQTELRQDLHDDRDWHKVSDIVTIQTPWMTLLGEHWKDDTGKILDYWRVQRSDSAVILTLQHGNRFLIPNCTFRPGVGVPTLDFPGGRIPASENIHDAKTRMQLRHDAVKSILRRELGISDSCDEFCESIQTLNQPEDEGWPINSSFSNQRLFGFVAHIRPDVSVDPAYLHPTDYTIDNVADLLSQLTCLQCRAVLLEWLQQQQHD